MSARKKARDQSGRFMAFVFSKPMQKTVRTIAKKEGTTISAIIRLALMDFVMKRLPTQRARTLEVAGGNK